MGHSFHSKMLVGLTSAQQLGKQWATRWEWPRPIKTNHYSNLRVYVETIWDPNKRFGLKLTGMAFEIYKRSLTEISRILARTTNNSSLNCTFISMFRWQEWAPKPTFKWTAAVGCVRWKLQHLSATGPSAQNKMILMCYILQIMHIPLIGSTQLFTECKLFQQLLGK